jgi:hypothetical protein
LGSHRLPLTMGENGKGASEEGNQSGIRHGPPIGRRFALALLTELLSFRTATSGVG